MKRVLGCRSSWVGIRFPRGSPPTRVDIIQDEAFDDLDAPVARVTQADVPMPYAKGLEKLAKPSAARVIEACRRVLYR